MTESLTGNKNFLGLFAANTMLGAAMPMLIILGGLAGLGLAPSPALATLPPSVQVLAGLIATGPFSWLMGGYGRKFGFVLGGVFAIVGSVICTLALLRSDFVMLCLGHMAFGAALACYQYFRFAAAEIVSKNWQPVAISLMLTSGLIAAFVGPELFIYTKDLVRDTPLAGAYASISALTLIGLVPLAFVTIDIQKEANGKFRSSLGTTIAILRRKPVLSAVIVGAVSQAVMVLLMASTPMAMVNHGYDETMTGDVIRWHIVAMFAPSFFTGFLIKRYGTKPIVIVGLLFLIVSAIAAASGLTPHHFYGSLILLGVGWNFGFIGATNILADSLAPKERSLVQGINDTIIALASTIFAFSGGAIVAKFGWTVLSITSIPIIVLALISLRPRQCT